MAEPTAEFDLDAVIEETLDLLTLRPSGEGRWVGDAPGWFGDVVFGGFVIAQAMTPRPGTRLPAGD